MLNENVSILNLKVFYKFIKLFREITNIFSMLILRLFLVIKANIDLFIHAEL